MKKYTESQREYVCPKDGHSILISFHSTCYPLNILCGDCFDCQNGKYEIPKGRLISWRELNQKQALLGG